METVGFIGLGNMGGPVAGHIQRAGFPMMVYDLRAEATRPFEARGARVVDSAAELARRSDVIITALPMPDDVEQVVCGANGILEGIRPQSIYVDISTSPPSLIRRLEPFFRAKGAFVLDAPVASGQPGAARGIHEVMVGGDKDKEIFARAEPGGIDLKKVRGYLALLREERPIPENLDAETLVDFSILPSAR